METVEVVIKVPKDLYEGIECRNGELETEYVCDELIKAVDKGTVLPKGHDRLISTGDLDITKLVDSDLEWVMGICDISRVQSMIDNAPTVIEADKED